MSIYNRFVLSEDRDSHNESAKGHLLRSRFETWHVERVLELNITSLHHPSVDL
jgi:hypothetical protein